eukprot:TRINITY_DN34175_c0_g1_i1.p2 TRINITY_DN34175_c0_g1~~TRINITY_DN34175_c0_g1_i1.p2  ORF type:complete len:100 (-),score=18.13 TRINITY_DN34175_c0_g1_i1:125-424(-)
MELYQDFALSSGVGGSGPSKPLRLGDQGCESSQAARQKRLSWSSRRCVLQAAKHSPKSSHSGQPLVCICTPPTSAASHAENKAAKQIDNGFIVSTDTER